MALRLFKFLVPRFRGDDINETEDDIKTWSDNTLLLGRTGNEDL
jgi:hypothetical protein